MLYSSRVGGGGLLKPTQVITGLFITSTAARLHEEVYPEAPFVVYIRLYV
jgi:hypothetical protein